MGTTYEEAGVDIKKGDEVTRRIKERLALHTGFCATMSLPNDQRTKVITSTDGVGTKIGLVNHFVPGQAPHILGQDVVAAVFNDIVTSGAAPWLFLDYIGAGQLAPVYISDLLEAIQHHCKACGALLVGGETAEMPSVYGTPDTMELVGFGVGLAVDGDYVDGHRIHPGDILIGLASSGPHCNGYSLINHLVYGHKLDVYRDEGLLYDLTRPTVLYQPILKDMAREILSENYQFMPRWLQVTLVGMAHITGGGLEANVNRMFPEEAGFRANINWEVVREITPEVFHRIQMAGNVSTDEMYRVFNMGIGYVLCVTRGSAEIYLEVLERIGAGPVVIGEVEDV